MKTRNYLIVSFILMLAMAFVGCTKDPGPTPAPTPINPVITVTGIPTSPIAYGDSVNFSWSISNYNWASLNGVNIQATGTKSTGRLLSNTTYEFKAVGPNGGNAYTSFAIKVGDWTTSKYGLVSADSKPWTLYASGSKTDSMSDYSMVDSADLNPHLRAEKQYFYPDGKYKVVFDDGSSNTAQWDVVGDSIELSDTKTGYKSTYFIDSISTTKMVLVKKGTTTTPEGEIPTWYKDVYKHQ